MATSDLPMSVGMPTTRPTAPMSLADTAAHEAGSYVRTPVERLRKQIARLEESLRIQREGRDSDLAQMRDTTLAESVRAEAEGSFNSTAWEIIRLQGQIREYRAELTAAVRYQDAAAHCSSAALAGDFDACLRDQDEMRACRCQLEQAGRLDLIGGA